jgi:hypothetical protein
MSIGDAREALPVKLKNLLLVLFILLAVAFSLYRLFGRDAGRGRVRRDIADELARFIVKEAAAGAKGKVLVLSPADTFRDPYPVRLASRVESHMAAAGFAPVVVEPVGFNALMESTAEPVSKEDFLGLVRKHADAALVISLVGIPKLTPGEVPGRPPPRIIVACSTIMPYLEKYPKGIVDVAIIARIDTTVESPDPALGDLGAHYRLLRLR